MKDFVPDEMLSFEVGPKYEEVNELHEFILWNINITLFIHNIIQFL